MIYYIGDLIARFMLIMGIMCLGVGLGWAAVDFIRWLCGCRWGLGP